MKAMEHWDKSFISLLFNLKILNLILGNSIYNGEQVKIQRGFYLYYLYYKTNILQWLTLKYQVDLLTIPVSIGAF